jgi:hypothetical protein
VNVPPSGRIAAQIDGLVSNYFEWVGAGVYTPDYRSGSMHGILREHLDALYYGYSDDALYLRLDFNPRFFATQPDFEIRVNADGENRFRLHAPVAAGKLARPAAWVGEAPLDLPADSSGPVQVAFQRIFELCLKFSLLGIGSQEKARVQLALWMNDLPQQVIPQEGWLTLEPTKELLSW